MTPEETRKLHELARRLDSTPRRVLSAVAQAIDTGSDAQATLRAIREGGPADTGREHSADLLLTPVSSYARDSVDSALEQLWRATQPAAP